MTVLEVENLHTQFPTSRGTVRAVDGVDLSVREGDIVGIVGESGSGKSVLADSIMSILEEPGRVTGGDIRLKGDSLIDKTESEMQQIRGDQMSIVFQDPASSLNPTLTVGEHIAEVIRLHQDVGESVSFTAEMKRKILGATKNSESWRKAVEMLEAISIPEADSRATDYPHSFSGGMRQRAMIAMALACKPDLLICDEPTTALDVTIQAQILDELRNLKDEFDTSILLITHNLGVVLELCNRVNVMYAGEIIERGTISEIFQNPEHPYTEGLMASTPRLDDPQERLESIPGNVPDLIEMRHACHFAPRCPESKRECYETEPDFRSVDGDESLHETACLRRGPEEKQI